MLKTVKCALAGGLLIVAPLAPAETSVEAALQNICSVVQTDDKLTLRKKIKRVQTEFNLKLRDYYSSISCDGDSLIRTAFKANAIDAGTLLLKKVSKGQLVAPEKDGKTLSDWVVENKFNDSPLNSVLQGRS